jgi:hypothetical protein
LFNQIGSFLKYSKLSNKINNNSIVYKVIKNIYSEDEITDLINYTDIAVNAMTIMIKLMGTSDSRYGNKFELLRDKLSRQ